MAMKTWASWFPLTGKDSGRNLCPLTGDVPLESARPEYVLVIVRSEATWQSVAGAFFGAYITEILLSLRASAGGAAIFSIP